MTSEEKFVVRPLLRWFKRQRAQWTLVSPKYGTSATGWDLEARRKNQDLLIEAKYIGGPFLASFAGLVAAPLAKRPQHFMVTKYRSWSYRVCWAIGSSYREQHLYQIFLDYLARSPKFWADYAETVRLKYVFFIRRGKVARIPFGSLLAIAKIYRKATLAKQTGGETADRG